MTTVCEVETCDRESHHGGPLCNTHLWRLRHYGDVRADVPIRAYTRRPVEVPPVDVVEVYRVAFAPAPAEGRGFLWLV